MNPLLPFIGGALLLLVATLTLLLLPFRHRVAGTEISRKQLNAAIYRDEFAELERDLAEGALSQDDYDQAKAELQRRLLEDSAAPATPAPGAPSSRKLPLALLLVLPVAATALYLLLGNPAAINPPQEKRFSQQDIESMVDGLAARLEKEPQNLQGWAMLARSYKAMGRLPEAVRAFEKAGSLVEADPGLLVSYADALASTAGFDKKVNALIDKALALDPENAQALWMRGTVAFEAKQYAQAVADWERLLALLEPGSEDAQIVTANIDEARQKGHLPAAKQKTGANNAKPAAKSAAVDAFVKGEVELAGGLAGKVPAGAMLMVIARPADGSRMPVAVWRVPAGKFPLAFTLDDSLSMSPDRRLSQFPQVVVEARLSASGQATPQPGDLFGPPQTVRLGSQGVRLKIDQVRQ